MPVDANGTEIKVGDKVRFKAARLRSIKLGIVTMIRTETLLHFSNPIWRQGLASEIEVIDFGEEE